MHEIKKQKRQRGGWLLGRGSMRTKYNDLYIYGNVCVYTHTYTRISIHTYTHIHTRIHTYIWKCHKESNTYAC